MTNHSNKVQPRHCGPGRGTTSKGRYIRLAALGVSGLLVACASIPSGPSVMVLPGSGKTFDQFRADDYLCRQYASQQSGGVTPNQASAASGVGSALVGSALGAAAGAAIGGGSGAAIGAGTGFAAGGIAGTGAASASGYERQDRYDMAYIQCMYANGHRVPIQGNFVNEPASQPVQPSSIPQPPPPGALPPP
jgi:hypothetical protein